MLTQNNKFKLSAEQDLKLYIFGFMDSPKVYTFLGYNPDKIMEALRAESGLIDSVEIRGSVSVNEILSSIQLDKEPHEPTRFESKMAFINGLKLVTDDFIKDDKDKEQIRKILERA